MPIVSAESRPSIKGIVLGVFILFQLVYLPAANFIKLIALRLPESTGELDDDIQLRGQQFPERVQALADTLGTAFVRYGELTGQAQGWSLFAPIFGHQASLPATDFDGHIIESTFVPSNRNQYLRHFRLPSSNCRLFNYEYRLALLYWTALSEDQMREEPDAWKKARISRVRRQQRSLQAFMHWRLREYLAVNPKPAPPKNVRLVAQITPNPPIDPFERPRTRLFFWIARIPLDMSAPPGSLPVQAFEGDPFSNRNQGEFDQFIWLPHEGPP
jgi:hypothetical protein